MKSDTFIHGFQEYILRQRLTFSSMCVEKKKKKINKKESKNEELGSKRKLFFKHKFLPRL